MKLQKVVGALVICLCATAQNARAQEMSDATSSTQSAQTAAPNVANDWVTLRLNLKPGSRYRMTTDSDTKMTIVTAAMSKRPAEKVEMVNTSRQSTDYNVLYNNADGTTQVRVTYGTATAKMHMTQNGKTLPASSPPNNLSGQSIEMKIAPNGKVSDVRGFEKVFDRAFDTSKMTGMTPKMRREMRDNMKKMFGKSFVEGLERQTDLGFPESPLRIGDSWSQKTKLNLGFFDTVLNSRRTLQSRAANLLSIGETGTLSMDSAPNASGFGGVKLQMAMNGSYNGTTILDANTGFMRSSSTSMNFGGRASGDAKAQQMALRFYMRSTARVDVEQLR